MIKKIISGGQTGADRAALDAAASAGLETGGWCPPGREAEDGIVPLKYPLKETPYDKGSGKQAIPRSLRTEWNVRDSDGTLILIPGKSTDDPGTRQTIVYAKKHNKPCLITDISDPLASMTIRKWIEKHRTVVLNIAGPSEKTAPGIYKASFTLLAKLFATQG